MRAMFLSCIHKWKYWSFFSSARISFLIKSYIIFVQTFSQGKFSVKKCQESKKYLFRIWEKTKICRLFMGKLFRILSCFTCRNSYFQYTKKTFFFLFSTLQTWNMMLLRNSCTKIFYKLLFSLAKVEFESRIFHILPYITLLKLLRCPPIWYY